MTPTLGPHGTYRRATTVEVEEYGGVYADGPRPLPGEPFRGEYPSDVMEGEYGIWLPHDCDEWVVAYGTRDHVIEKAREFVASVEAAIRHLEELP